MQKIQSSTFTALLDNCTWARNQECWVRPLTHSDATFKALNLDYSTWPVLPTTDQRTNKHIDLNSLMRLVKSVILVLYTSLPMNNFIYLLSLRLEEVTWWRTARNYTSGTTHQVVADVFWSCLYIKMATPHKTWKHYTQWKQLNNKVCTGVYNKIFTYFIRHKSLDITISSSDIATGTSVK